MELHGDSNVVSRSHDDLINDALYLFKYRYQAGHWRQPPPNLCVVLIKRESFNSRGDIYINDPANSSSSLIAKYKDHPSSPFSVLDDGYVTTMRSQGEKDVSAFFDWLLKSSRFHDTPKLIDSGYQPTAEWRFLADTDIMALLFLIQKLCSESRESFVPGQRVADLKVQSSSGTLQRLGDLAVPTSTLRTACPHIDFADLQDPDGWLFLAKFGILTQPSTTAWIKELQALYKLDPDSLSVLNVKRVYRALASEYSLAGQTQIRYVRFVPPDTERANYIANRSLTT
jgi:hypothetical protein